MSKLIRSGTTFSPPVPAGRLSRGSASPAPSLRLSSTVLLLVGLPHALVFLLYWLPEVRDIPGRALVFDQLAPLVSPLLASESVPLADGQTTRASALAAVLMIGGLLLWGACRLKPWPLRFLIVPGSVGLALVAVVQLVLWLGPFGLQQSVCGLLLLGVLAGTLLALARQAVDVDVDRLEPRSLALSPVIVFAVLAPLPYAVGRAVFGEPLRTAAALLPSDLQWAAVDSPATLPLYLAGVAVGLLVWAAWGLLPPWSGRSVGRGIAAIVLAVGPGLVIAGGQATTAADAAANTLQVGSPADALPQLCTAWWRRSTPARTIAISGDNCRRVSVFEGYQLLRQRTAKISFGEFRQLETPEGNNITSGTVSALYGNTLVALATTKRDGTPNVVVGLNITNGEESWRYTCPAGTLRIRLARVSGGDEPAAGRKTRKGETASVVLKCGGNGLRLDPGTGRQR